MLMWIVVLDPALGNIRSEVETSVRVQQGAVGANSSEFQTLLLKFRAALFPAEVRGDESGQWRYLFAVMPRGFSPACWVELVVEKESCLYF